MLTERRQIRLLGALAIIVYFASYITRVNYAAVLVEFISAEGVTKAAASAVTTVTFITYGIGQLLSGWLGDKLNPQRLIFWGLAVTVTMNILMPVCAPLIPVMAVLWGINGLAQAFLWPPLVRLLTTALSEVDYARLAPKISLGSAAGTIAVYLISPLLIEVAQWRAVFWLCAAVAAGIAVLWLVGTRPLLKGIDWSTSPHPLKNQRAPGRERAAASPLLACVTALLPVILLCALLHGVLRDGVSTWVPSFLSESFRIPNSLSILTVAGLQVFHILCSLTTYRVLVWFKGDIFACTAAYHGVLVAVLLLLAVFGTGSLWLSILLLALVSAPVYGINFLITGSLPGYFHGSEHVSLIAGLLNFAVYAGSALSAWLFAWLSDMYGWSAVLLSWVLFALGGLVLILVCLQKVKRKNERRN